MHKTWKSVNLYFSCQADGSHACMHSCALYMCMCQFLCVYKFAFVCVGCQMRRARRGRGYVVGGHVCLFITQWPPWFQGDMATLVLGPLALVWLWPALALPKPSALTFSALCFCLFHLFFFTLGSCLDFHLCYSHNVLCWLSYIISALGKIFYVTCNPWVKKNNKNVWIFFVLIKQDITCTSVN